MRMTRYQSWSGKGLCSELCFMLGLLWSLGCLYCMFSVQWRSKIYGMRQFGYHSWQHFSLLELNAWNSLWHFVHELGSTERWFIFWLWRSSEELGGDVERRRRQGWLSFESRRLWISDGVGAWWILLNKAINHFISDWSNFVVPWMLSFHLLSIFFLCVKGWKLFHFANIGESLQRLNGTHMDQKVIACSRADLCHDIPTVSNDQIFSPFHRTLKTGKIEFINGLKFSSKMKS